MQKQGLSRRAFLELTGATSGVALLAIRGEGPAVASVTV